MKNPRRLFNPPKTITKSLQYILGIGFLWWIFQTVEWSSFLATASMLSVGTLALVVTASVCGVVAQFGSWHALASHVSRYRPIRIAQADLVIRFMNSLLPSRVSGRSLAPLVIRHYTGSSWTEATSIVVVHTALYATFYGTVTMLGVLIASGNLPPGLLGLLALAGGLYLATGTVIILGGFAPRPFLNVISIIQSWSRKVPGVGDKIASVLGSFGRFTNETSIVFRDLITTPGPIAVSLLGLVGALVVFPAIRFWVLLAGFGSQFEPMILLPVYLITAYSVTVLPITPAGLGITEATAIAVFIVLGLPREVVVATVLIDRVVGVYLPALSGWYPMMKADLRSIQSGCGDG